MVLAIYQNVRARAYKYKSRFYHYTNNGVKVEVVKSKKRTPARMILEGLKLNKQPDNQDAAIPSKYSDGRHEMTSEPESTSKPHSWPPEEGEDLYGIVPSVLEDGSLEDNVFNEHMKDIFGSVSKKNSPSIPVTSRHIHQLEALQKQLPQDDRSYVEVWIKNLRYHKEKDIEGNTSTYLFVVY
jgi:hypothetical protein